VPFGFAREAADDQRRYDSADDEHRDDLRLAERVKRRRKVAEGELRFTLDDVAKDDGPIPAADSYDDRRKQEKRALIYEDATDLQPVAAIAFDVSRLDWERWNPHANDFRQKRENSIRGWKQIAVRAKNLTKGNVFKPSCGRLK
jgi:hypothetical protein